MDAGRARECRTVAGGDRISLHAPLAALEKVQVKARERGADGRSHHVDTIKGTIHAAGEGSPEG